MPGTNSAPSGVVSNVYTLRYNVKLLAELNSTGIARTGSTWPPTKLLRGIRAVAGQRSGGPGLRTGRQRRTVSLCRPHKSRPSAAREALELGVGQTPQMLTWDRMRSLAIVRSIETKYA